MILHSELGSPIFQVRCLLAQLRAINHSLAKLWNDKFSRKEFLAAFSAQKGYSPTDLDAWQRTSEGEIKRTKV